MPSGLNKIEIDTILEKRRTQLQALESVLSKKLYYKLERRLTEEQQQWYGLLDIQNQHTEASARYSYVLDPDYFEQKLLPLP